MSSGRAHVDEILAEDDRGFPLDSALFAATYYSSGEVVVPEPGPGGVSIEEALAWAEDKTAEIEITLCDGRSFSASDRAGLGLPKWPPSDFEGRPRRTKGWEFVDRGEDAEPIIWDVQVDFTPAATHPGCGAYRAGRDRAALREAMAPELFEPNVACANAISLRASTVAPTYDQALDAVGRAMLRVEACAGSSELSRWHWELRGVFPRDSKVASLNLSNARGFNAL